MPVSPEGNQKAHNHSPAFREMFQQPADLLQGVVSFAGSVRVVDFRQRGF
jgi:hypothetical protein